MEEIDIKKQIIDAFLSIVAKEKRLPTVSDFTDFEITRDKIRSHFGNFTKLTNFMIENHEDEISNSVLLTHIAFSKSMKDVIKKNSKQRYVISTVIDSAPVNSKALDALRSYCEKNEAKLLLIPCADVWDRKRASTKENGWTFDPSLKDEIFVFEDVQLNDNLFVSSLRVSAKQINPTTGLSRIGQRNSSFILASPKQFLEFVPTSSLKSHAIMTPGTISIPKYTRDKYMSERLSYIAKNDHLDGAVVIEVVGKKQFHFRQVQFDTNGSFIDLGIRYNADGSTDKEVATLIMGDYHVGWTDLKVLKATKEISEKIDLQRIVVHDFFDGMSINHHNKHKPIERAKVALKGKDSLQEEIREGCRSLNSLLDLMIDGGTILFTRGNHDDRLENWLNEGEYVNDYRNHRYALPLAIELLDGKDPLRYAFESENIIKDRSLIIWANRDESFKIAGIEIGQHGDKGSNGSRGSMATAEKAYGQCVIGHAHSAAILRGVYRVGTSTLLKMDYNKGPGSWTQTHCLVYDNGHRQLINIIDGEWRNV